MLNRQRHRFIDDVCDLTFLFDIRESGIIKTVVTDNLSECDVALIDLPRQAKLFYENKIYELSTEKIINEIREKLHKREGLAV